MKRNVKLKFENKYKLNRIKNKRRSFKDNSKQVPTSMLDWLKDLDNLLNKNVMTTTVEDKKYIDKVGTSSTNKDKIFSVFKQSRKEYNTWMGIGHEIYLRKTLLFHAYTDLKTITKDFVPNISDYNLLKLASADVFVEKAQTKLFERSKILMRFGILTTSIVLFLMIGSALYIDYSSSNVVANLIKDEYQKIINTYIAYILIKTTTISAFILGAIYFLTSLSRACFHEGTVLLNKRHALRFGRLMLYINDGHLNFKDSNEAFMWNEEFTSAFKDIKPDKITKTLWHKIIEVFPEMLKEIKGFKKNNTVSTNNE
jgi:hypothetical protein